MVFHRKKASSIDRRLDDLQRELARVGRELKTAAKPGRMPLAAPAGKPPEPAQTSALLSDGITGVEPPADDLFAHGVRTGTSSAPADYFSDLPARNISSARSPAPAAPGKPRSGREKFAHYFMAGHFHNLRPSRQESRIVRNKAILMLIAAAALLAWLLYFLRSH